ncbi:peptide ABC transporter substrate-binding protein [Baekduia soli]|uniref:Peptide ABC transporter substrate-binding protein n=1 Tax=Baekduia soli TaxID=496014 RepID=A0A5B8UB73_9ACTN|nr:peptide ABC transporter substrate-binding protein [Baekduia soli]QEC50433.1 peptide ABC transporter substrate-binding protein [Baekduia soli]
MRIHAGARRRGRRRAQLAGVAVAATAALAAGCGGGKPVDTGQHAPAGAGGTSGGAALTSATFAEPPNSPTYYIFPLTPLTNYNGNNDAQFQDLIYRPLYWFGKDGTPGFNDRLSLADTPTYRDGGRTAVVKLKPYKWSDGTPITSRDVVFWMNLLVAAKDNWAGYVPGEFPDNVKSVKAQGADTIAFTFDKAYNPDWVLYNELSQITPMPQHAWDKTSAAGTVGDADMTPAGAKKVYAFLAKEGGKLGSYAANPLWKVVSGPWRIGSFDTSNRVTLVPNPAYSGPVKPVLKTFKLVPFTSDTAEYNVLRAGGDLDYGYLPAQNAAQIPQLASNGYKVSKTATWSINYTVLNYNNAQAGPLFKQLYIRQAMQTLIDQGTWVKAALGGYGAETHGPVPIDPPNPFASPLLKQGVYPYAPDKAVAMLKAHGWDVKPDGVSTCASPGSGPSQCGAGIKGGAGLHVTLEYANGIAALDRGIQSVQSTFSKAGIKLELKPEPLDTLNAHEVRCKPGESKCDWQMVQGDLAWTFQPNYYPEGSLIFSSQGSSNAGGYSDPQADKLITATHISTDHQALVAYEDYLARQLPVLWTPKPDALVAVSTKLSGTQPKDPFGNLYPEEWRPAG